MKDDQGRPPFFDEGRVEHHQKRPLENYLASEPKAPPSNGGGSSNNDNSNPFGSGGGGPLRDSVVNRINKVLSTSSNVGGNQMSTQQSLEGQLHWCNQTRRNLQSLQQDLRNAALIFVGTVDELRGLEYLHELLLKIIPLCDEFNDLAFQTSQHLEDAHIDYVMQQADSVCNQLAVINQIGKR